MPKRVRIEGLGIVEFPDSWDDGAISVACKALKEGKIPEGGAPRETLREGPPPGPLQRYGGAFMRGMAEKSLAGRLGGLPPAFYGAAERAPLPQPGALERAAEQVGAISDPLSLATFALGGPVGAGIARGMGAAGKMGQFAGGAAGAIGLHRGATQAVEEPSRPWKVLPEMAKGVAIGIPLGLAGPIGNPIVRTIAEALIFGTETSAMLAAQERRMPTKRELKDIYTESAAFMGVLRATHGLPQMAVRGLSKPKEHRTTEEQAAVKAIPAPQMKAIKAEIVELLQAPEKPLALPPGGPEAPILAEGAIRLGGVSKAQPPGFRRGEMIEPEVPSAMAALAGAKPPPRITPPPKAVQAELPFGTEGFLNLEMISDIGKGIKKILAEPSRGYLDAVKLVEKRRINMNLAAKNAQIMEDAIKKDIPDVETREQIPDAIETGLVAPEILEKAKPYKEKFDIFYKVGETEGLFTSREEFMENYVPHIVLEIPKGEARGRRVGTGGGRFERKPFFAKPRVRKETGESYTVRELEEMGYVLEKDIAKLMPIYEYRLGRAIANRRFFDAMREKGALKSKFEIPPGEEDLWRPVHHPEWSRYLAISLERQGKPVIKLVGQPLYVKKEAYKVIENIIPEYSDPSWWRRSYITTRSGVKRIIMFNPMVHGVNIESQMIMFLGREYLPRRFESFFGKKMSPKEINKLELEMINNGVELEGLYDLYGRFARDEYNIKLGGPRSAEQHKDAVASALLSLNPVETVKAIRDASDSVLWEHWVKPGQMLLYTRQKKLALKKGFTEERAGHIAAGLANDAMGTIPATWFTKGQRKLLLNILFARNWNVSNARTIWGATGAIHPRLAKGKAVVKPVRFEGYTDAEMAHIGRRYAASLAVGALGLFVTSNLLSKALSGHWAWENERGHELDIDTGRIDAKERKIYIKNWFFRQIDDYIKFVKAALPGTNDKMRDFLNAKAEPLMRTIMETIINYSIWERRPITEEGAPAVEQLKAHGKHVLTSLTPYDVLAGREGEVRGLVETLTPLTGTWIRHGMPTHGNVVLGDMIKDYFHWSSKEGYLDREQKKKVDVLLQRANKARRQGKPADVHYQEMIRYLKPEVSGMPTEGRLSLEQVTGLAKKRTDYPRYIFGDRLLNEKTLRFLESLSPEKRKKYEAALLEHAKQEPSELRR